MLVTLALGGRYCICCSNIICGHGLGRGIHWCSVLSTNPCPSSAPSLPIVVEPESVTNATANLETRNGNHYSTAWSGSGCTGQEIDYIDNFGCGGTCHNGYSNKIFSLFLRMDGKKNPKATASLFDGYNCNGNQIASAGIWKDNVEGCTDVSGANSCKLSFWFTAEFWASLNHKLVYLYWNC